MSFKIFICKNCNNIVKVEEPNGQNCPDCGVHSCTYIFKYFPKVYHKCKRCGKEFEKTNIITDVSCKVCQSSNMEKYEHVDSAPAIHYKSNTGLVLKGQHKDGWDWGHKQPNPLEGHKITQEERQDIEKKLFTKGANQL
jgi:DNA-directed RNA polymerase subunit RPC12/RpoP